eukprot:464487-Prorocentrum_minimum.AAC.1
MGGLHLRAFFPPLRAVAARAHLACQLAGLEALQPMGAAHEPAPLALVHLRRVARVHAAGLHCVNKSVSKRVSE